eukprot:scaffold4892_cov380-Prasinococcus_capsulatus_cf.AAC.1
MQEVATGKAVSVWHTLSTVGPAQLSDILNTFYAFNQNTVSFWINFVENYWQLPTPFFDVPITCERQCACAARAPSRFAPLTSVPCSQS